MPAARKPKVAARGLGKPELDALVEEATVDCYNEEEQLAGLFTMIEENLKLPFETTVLGLTVRVEEVDLTDRGEIVAICVRDRYRQSVPILDVTLPSPPPKGWEWIAAYRHWAAGHS